MQFSDYFPELQLLCEKYSVHKLYALGSVTRGTTTVESDVDLLVHFSEIPVFDYFDNYLDFKEKLEELFSKKVDLVEIQTLKNPFLIEAIEADKILIYGQANRKIATGYSG